jgi:hypothetical protein
MIMLPMLGSARLAPPGTGGTATIRRVVDGGTVDISGGGTTVALPGDVGRDGRCWRAMRRLHAAANGRRIAVHFDDCDPFRDCHRLHAATRLDNAAVRRWQHNFTAAWSVLARYHTHYADTIAAGLTSLVPLENAGTNRGKSASSRDAFGAVAVAHPPNGTALAASLVHEFQHAKLGALLDLVPFLHSDREARYYAPWRDDPRPLDGLLQGAYAYLGVTDFWRVQRAADDRDTEIGHFEFARWRDQTRSVVQQLASCGGLTEIGQRFVAGMQATLTAWQAERVPSRYRALARAAATDHRLSWRLRNLRVDPAGIDQLVTAWVAGRPRPSLDGLGTTVAAAGNPRAADPRLHLAYLRLADPQRFRQAAQAGSAGVDGTHATAGDISYIAGDLPSAVRSYLAEIDADPARASAWAGLTLACSRTDPGRGREFLLRRPEVAFATYHGILAATGAASDPMRLATWLGTAAYHEPDQPGQRKLAK